MAIKEAFSRECIILDACCIINLFASRQMRNILKSIPRSLSVAAYVKDYEVLCVYSGPINNVQASSERIDLQPFIDEKLLLLVDIESEDEMTTYVNFAERLDDGEAITGAIALHRSWAIATDDAASLRLFQRNIPQAALVSTLDLVKYWADTNKPPDELICETLLNIKTRGRYEPNKNHPLSNWWKQYL